MVRTAELNRTTWPPALPGGLPPLDRIAWPRAAADLDSHGCATVGPLLSPQQCRAMSALYALGAAIPQPHRDGAGTASAAASTSISPTRCRPDRGAAHRPLPAPRRHRQPLERADADRVRYPQQHAEFLERCHKAGQTQADAAAAAVRGRRLQLPAPGSLRRARLPAAGGHPAVGAGRRFHRRRVRAHRAAPAHAVAGRGGAAAAGRGRGVSGAPSPACRARAASIGSTCATA